MPTLPPTVASNYDSVTDLLNASRFRLNDKISSLYPTGGKILDETTASTQQAVFNAFRKIQDLLCDFGAERFQAEVIIPDIPVVTSQDPASQISLSWSEYFDGSNFSSTPVLPDNLILPLWIAERPSGQNCPFPRVDNPNMTCCTDGLPMLPKQQRNGCWEWRGDTIYAPGATVTVDWRIRYRAYLQDIKDVGNVRWWNQVVPIMRCQDALSALVCAEFASARAAAAAPGMAGNLMGMAKGFMDQGMAATKLLANRDVMKNQRDDVRRQPYGGGSRGRGGYGYRG